MWGGDWKKDSNFQSKWKEKQKQKRKKKRTRNSQQLDQSSTVREYAYQLWVKINFHNLYFLGSYAL